MQVNGRNGLGTVSKHGHVMTSPEMVNTPKIYRNSIFMGK
jgi:hypothetical protein